MTRPSSISAPVLASKSTLESDLPLARDGNRERGKGWEWGPAAETRERKGMGWGRRGKEAGVTVQIWRYGMDRGRSRASCRKKEDKRRLL